MHLSFNFRNFNIHINITEHIFIMILYTQIQHIQQMQYIQHIQHIQHIQYIQYVQVYITKICLKRRYNQLDDSLSLLPLLLLWDLLFLLFL
jgi:hypothetical protein